MVVAQVVVQVTQQKFDVGLRGVRAVEVNARWTGSVGEKGTLIIFPKDQSEGRRRNRTVLDESSTVGLSE